MGTEQDNTPKRSGTVLGPQQVFQTYQLSLQGIVELGFGSGQLGFEGPLDNLAL